MTGTATLLLYVFDLNDNVPTLSVNHVVVCIGDGPTRTNLTAMDPDNEPFGGPFTFELLGEVKGKWSVDPSHGQHLKKTGGSKEIGGNVLQGTITVFLHFHRLRSEPGEGNFSVFRHTYG